MIDSPAIYGRMCSGAVDQQHGRNQDAIDCLHLGKLLLFITDGMRQTTLGASTVTPRRRKIKKPPATALLLHTTENTPRIAMKGSAVPRHLS